MSNPIKAICRRCHGTGHHSYHRERGTICFGCDGKGYKLVQKLSIKDELFTERKPTVKECLIAERAERRAIGRKRVLERRSHMLQGLPEATQSNLVQSWIKCDDEAGYQPVVDYSTFEPIFHR